MAEYDQEQSVVGRCITGSASQLVGSGRTKDEIIQELGAVGAAAQYVWRKLYPMSGADVAKERARILSEQHERERNGPEMYGGQQHGVPVLNSPAPPQQAHTQPVATPDGPLPWHGNFHPNVSPADMSGNPKWLGFVPFKGKSGAMCAETGYPWAETTYAMLMNRMMPVVDEDGKPKFGTAWGTLAWLIETSDPTHMQYGKNNTYKIAQCKAVMLEVGRRNPPEPHTPVRERGGRFVESAAETTAMMHEKGFVMAEDQPPMPVVADNDEEWGNISTPF